MDTGLWKDAGTMSSVVQTRLCLEFADPVRMLIAKMYQTGARKQSAREASPNCAVLRATDTQEYTV